MNVKWRKQILNVLYGIKNTQTAKCFFELKRRKSQVHQTFQNDKKSVNRLHKVISFINPEKYINYKIRKASDIEIATEIVIEQFKLFKVSYWLLLLVIILE